MTASSLSGIGGGGGGGTVTSNVGMNGPAGGLDAKSVASGKRADLKSLLPTSFVEKTLFQVGYTISRDNDLSDGLSWVLTIIEDLQLFTFPMASALHSGMPETVESVLDLFVLPENYSVFSIVNIMAILVVLVTAALVGSVVALMHRNKIPITLLRVLRMLYAIIMTILNIPLLTVLLMGINCVGPNATLPQLGISCSSTSHVPFLIFNAVSLLLFVPMLIVGSVIFVETCPASTNPLAKPNGRIDAHSVLLRMVFVVFKVYTADMSGLPVWIYLGVTVAGLGYLAYSLIAFQPYYLRSMNVVRAGMAFGSCWAMIATMVLYALFGPHTGVYWTTLIPASILGFGCGAYLSQRTLDTLIRRTVIRNRLVRAAEGGYMTTESSHYASRCASTSGVNNDQPLPTIQGSEPDLAGSDGAAVSATNVNAVTRMVQRSESSSGFASPTYPKTVSLAGQGNISPGGSTVLGGSILGFSVASRISGALNKGEQIANLGRRRASSIALPAHGSLTGVTPTGSSNLKPLSKDRCDSENKLIKSASVDTLIIVTEQKAKVQDKVFDRPEEVEVSLRFTRDKDNLTDRQLAVGLELIERGLAEFPTNHPQVLLSAAMYLTEFFGSDGERAAEVLFQSLKNKQRHLPVDVRFMIYVRDRKTRENGKHVLDTAALDQLMRKVRTLHLLSLCAVRDVWETLRVGGSDAALADVLSKLAEYEQGADETYRRLLERDGKSKTVLRLYAGFLTFVKADASRAAQILELADELETVESRMHTNQARSGAGGGGVTGSMSTTLATRYSVDESSLPVRSNIFSARPAPSSTIPLTSGDLSLSDDIVSPSSGSHDVVGFRAPASLSANAVTGPAFVLPTISAVGSPTPAAAERSTAFTIPPTTAQQPMLDALDRGSASQTSGTSASRQARKKLVKRRMLVDRVEAPLNKTTLMIVPVLLFALCVAIGAYISLKLYDDTTRFLNVEFSSARNARGQAREIIESVRMMVYHNMLQNRQQWEVNHNITRVALNALVNIDLPTLNQQYRLLPVPPMKRRVFLRRNLNGTADFDTALLSPLDAVERVAQVATIALGMEYRELMPAVFDRVPQMNMLTLHMRDLFDLVGQIVYSFLDAYKAQLTQNTTILVILAILSAGFLAGAVGVLYKLVLRQFFANENIVFSLLRRIQRRSLSNLTLAIEEEIECFRDVTIGDSDDANNIDDLSELRSSNGGSGSVGEKKSRWTQSKKYTTWLCGFAALLAVLFLIMYSITITSLNQYPDLERLILSLDRRLYTTMLRVFTNEWVSPDTTVSSTVAVRNLRGVLADLVMVHERLLNDAYGLSVTLPALTSLPRACPTAAVCLSGPVRPSIGYTLESGMLPLNVAVTRMIETASEVFAAFVRTGSTQVFATTPEFAKYELLILQATDLIPRVQALDIGIQNMLNSRVAFSSMVTVAVFVGFLVALGAGVVFAHVHVLTKLRRESRTLTTLPFLLPSAVVSTTPELNAFVESGGLTLQSSSNGDGDTAM